MVPAQRDLIANNSPKRPAIKKTPEPEAFKALGPVEVYPLLSHPAIPMDDDNSQPALAEGEASGRDPPKHRNFAKTHSKKSKAHLSGAPPQGHRPAVIPVKLEPKVVQQDLPEELLENLKAELLEHNRAWFSVEFCAAPSPAWKGHGDYPDLHDYLTEKGLLDLISAAAQIGTDHLIRIENLRAIRVEGNARKRFFYRLQCTSELGLKNVIISPHIAEYVGYSISFFQDQSSILGVRHQMNLVNLPPPFRHYSTPQMLQVLASQNWDIGAIEHIQIGTRISPGEPKKLTGMLDIYVKQSSVINHGSNGALANAGTEYEILAKAITFPPSAVVFGRNPNPAVRPLLEEGLLKGQYITKETSDPPSSGVSNLMEEATGHQMHPTDYGKLYIRQVLKPGYCKFCWGPRHGGPRGDNDCIYKDYCKSCLGKFADMPHKGFHHACGSFITSTPKPDAESKADRKRSFQAAMAEDVEPYKPSKAFIKRQQMFQKVYLQTRADARSPPDNQEGL